jgi:hypothetical protein
MSGFFEGVVVDQGGPDFDDPTVDFDDPAVFFDGIGPTQRTLTGGVMRAASAVVGWVRARGPWLGLRPFTQKTSAQKAEPQRRREGPMTARARMVREH